MWVEGKQEILTSEQTVRLRLELLTIAEMDSLEIDTKIELMYTTAVVTNFRIMYQRLKISNIPLQQKAADELAKASCLNRRSSDNSGTDASPRKYRSQDIFLPAYCKGFQQTEEKGNRFIDTVTMQDAGTQTTSSSKHPDGKQSKAPEMSVQPIGLLEELIRTIPDYGKMTTSSLQSIIVRSNLKNRTQLSKEIETREDLVAILTLAWFDLKLDQTYVKKAKDLWKTNVRTLRGRVHRELKPALVARLLLQPD